MTKCLGHVINGTPLIGRNLNPSKCRVRHLTRTSRRRGYKTEKCNMTVNEKQLTHV